MTRKINEARATLRNYHALVERTYKGDTDAIVALVDLHTAISLAKLTDRQSEALALVYGDDLTQASACRSMGIERSALTEHLRLALDAIDEIYEYWAWLGGEMSREKYEKEAV